MARFDSSENMSALSDIHDLTGTLILSTFFIDIDRGVPARFAMLRRVLVRLCDKTAYEYRQAKRVLADARGREIERLAPALRYTDHMENAINSIRRCYRIFEALKTEQNLLKLDRMQRRRITEPLDGIVDLRDTFEHLDEKLGGYIGVGEPIMLRVTEDQLGVQIGPHTVTFKDLERAIVALHGIAQTLITITIDNLPPSTSRGP